MTMLPLDLARAPAARGASALLLVRRGILERAAERRALRIETIPAMWPMTRHLVRRMAERMIAEGLLDARANGTVRVTDAGLRVLREGMRAGG